MTELELERSGRSRVRLTPETPALPRKLVLGVLPPNPARRTFRLRREAAAPVLVVATLALVAGTLALLKDVMLPTLSPAAPASIWVQPPKAAPTSETTPLVRLATHLKPDRRGTHSEREEARTADRRRLHARGRLRPGQTATSEAGRGRDDGSPPVAPLPHPSSSGSSSSSGSISDNRGSGEVGDDSSAVSPSGGSSGPGPGASSNDATSHSSPSGSSGSESTRSGSSNSGSSGSGSTSSGSSGSGSSESGPSGSDG